MNDNLKYIRIFSDIHLDFDVPSKLKNFDPNVHIWSPIPLDTDKETVLILAGDIWHAKKPISFMNFSWFEKISNQFGKVLFLLGNHDFWNGNLVDEYTRYRNFLKEKNLLNVELIQNNYVVINNTKFIGGTLWVDYNNCDKDTIDYAERYSNDFKYIKNGIGFAKLKPFHLVIEHKKTRKYLEENIFKDNPQQKIWVLSHHAPTSKSIPFESSKYDSDDILHDTGLESSPLEYLFQKVDVWVHGHTHAYKNYIYDKTRIIVNPRGYSDQNTGYLKTGLFDFNGNLISE